MPAIQGQHCRGDIILTLDEAAVTGADYLIRMLAGEKIGREIEIVSLRNGSRHVLSRVPGERVPRS